MDARIHNIGIGDEVNGIWDCVFDLLRGPNGGGEVAVVALPNVKNPRSLVVAYDRRAAARLIRRQFSAGGLVRNLRAEAVAILISTGLAKRIPTFALVAPTPRSDLGYHEWLLKKLAPGTRVGAVLLGPPRANRKPVVLLTNDRGCLVAVAKFGVNEVTRPLVRHEAFALKQVSGALRGTVHVPRLLASDSVGSCDVVLMAPLPAVAPGRPLTRSALIGLVGSVAAIDRRPGACLHDVASHPRLALLRPRVEGILGLSRRAEIGSFHGDLHPGNLAVAEDGRLVLWDWERWGYGAPVGFDLLHHDLQSWVTREGMAPREAAFALIAQAPMILEPLGVPSSLAMAVACDYLIRIAARYAADEQDRAGSALGAIEQWLFPAVLAERTNEAS